MKKLNAKVSKLFHIFDTSSLRQRVIVAFALFIAIHAAWDLLIFQPQLQKLASHEAKIMRDKETIAKLDKLFDKDSSHELANNIGNAVTIKRQIRQIDMQIALASNEFIPPDQMPNVLQGLLKKNDSLRVTALNSEPATLLNISEKTDLEESLFTPIYKHALTIKFEGDYLSALKYIREVEKADGRIFWDSVHINSDEYPITRVSISLYTLSLNEGWIGV